MSEESRVRQLFRTATQVAGAAALSFGPTRAVIDRLKDLEQRALTALGDRIDRVRPRVEPQSQAPVEAPVPPPRPEEPRPNPTLKQRFRMLLDGSLDPSRKAGHPAFSIILDQLVPDEALILSLFHKRERQPMLEIQAGSRLGWSGRTIIQHFSAIGETVGVRHPDALPSYIDNLCRLGLVRITGAGQERDVYELLEGSPECERICQEISRDLGLTAKLKRKTVELTSWGRRFCEACSA